MKLKFYLRGLGIGIILTTLFFIIKGNELSDEEILQEATRLGMVMSQTEEVTEVLVKETEEKVEATSSEEIDSTEENIEGSSSEEIDSTEENIEGSSSEEKEESIEQTTNTENVVLVIKSGESSDSVSRKLYQLGLVESADEYDRYLCANGYDKVISVGTYEIPFNTSGEDIAKIITKRK